VAGYLISLFMGLGVGVAYALVQVRSPAPPLIALVGLLGMVLGEQAIDMAKRHFQPTPQTRRRSLPVTSERLASPAAARKSPHERDTDATEDFTLLLRRKVALLSVPW
jgi:XapX domain-containing protein